MRKSVVAFFLLVIASAAVFFVGWVQFSVPPNSYGVLRSKTSGVDPVVLRNGHFRWAWERVLPTNATIELFRIEAIERDIKANGTLPSAEVYSTMTGSTTDFSYEITGKLAFMTKSESLPILVAERAVSDQAALDAWEERTAAEITDFIARRLRAYAEDPAELDRILGAGSTPRLIADIERAFPDVESVSCVVKTARFPDLALYRMAKGLYEYYLQRRRSIIAASASEAATADVKSRLRFEALERYGELLEKHPILLKYLAIEAASGSEIAELLKVLGE
jgi:hypothetical protein